MKILLIHLPVVYWSAVSYCLLHRGVSPLRSCDGGTIFEENIFYLLSVLHLYAMAISLSIVDGLEELIPQLVNIDIQIRCFGLFFREG